MGLSDGRPGTYVLILRSDHRLTIRVGRWGELTLAPGYYLYVGSAFGPGGLRARVMRHARQEKVRRWHVDYLRAHTTLVAVWHTSAPERREHHWAEGLTALEALAPMDGFGSSDCRCPAHLFFSAGMPDSDWLVRAADEPVEATGFADDE